MSTAKIRANRTKKIIPCMVQGIFDQKLFYQYYLAAFGGSLMPSF
jgi:hypothetical protein